MTVQKQLEQPQEVLISVYCKKCEKLIERKPNAPLEFLEMSFYRLLEQYIYNQDIITSNKTVKGQICMHSYH